MTNKETYLKIFMDAFKVTKEEAEGLKYREHPSWDSVGHMNLVSDIENAFDIMMDTEDIIDFSSYEKGIEILSKKYDIDF